MSSILSYIMSVVSNKEETETKSLIENEDKDNEFASTSNEEDVGIINDKEDIHDDDEDEEDEVYDPNEVAEIEQAVNDELLDSINDEELENDIQDIGNAKKEDELPLIGVNEEDEEKIINSEDFEQGLLSAFDGVKEKILSMAREQYMNDTGMEVTDEMIEDAAKLFADNTSSAEESDDDDNNVPDEQCDDEQDYDEEYVDPELFAKEMDDALDIVRKLGAKHQEKLVNKICDTYNEINGIEATTEQIGAIFSRIKERLSTEARDDFIEVNDAEDDEHDVDYNPNEEPMQQIKSLEEWIQEIDNDDVENDENDENDVDDTNANKKVPILVASELASKFAEINVSGVDDDNKGNGEDEEHCIPEKDRFDYVGDIDDVKSQQSVDENGIALNMIDI